MTYKIEFTKTAQKELKKQSVQIQKRLLLAIIRLSANPKKGSVRPMIGVSSWRLRVGSYRVIYDINDNTLVILIIKVGHRRDVYKND